MVNKVYHVDKLRTSVMVSYILDYFHWKWEDPAAEHTVIEVSLLSVPQCSSEHRKDKTITKKAG